MASPKLTDVEGIGPVGAQNLRRAGIRSAEALADATLAEIEAVPGIGHTTAARAKRSAAALVGTSHPRVVPGRATPTRGATRTAGTGGRGEAGAGKSEAKDRTSQGAAGKKSKGDKKKDKKSKSHKDDKAQKGKRGKGKKGKKGKKKG